MERYLGVLVVQVHPADEHPAPVVVLALDPDLCQLPLLLALGLQQRRDAARLPRLRDTTLQGSRP